MGAMWGYRFEKTIDSYVYVNIFQQKGELLKWAPLDPLDLKESFEIFKTIGYIAKNVNNNYMFET